MAGHRMVWRGAALEPKEEMSPQPQRDEGEDEERCTRHRSESEEEPSRASPR